MRIQDLLQLHTDQVQAVVDVSDGNIDLSSFLRLPHRVSYEHRTSTEVAQQQLGEGVLLVATAGAEEAYDGSLDNALAACAALRSGAMLFMALTWQTQEFPYHRMLDIFSSQRLQILQVGTLKYARMHIGLIAQCVERIQTPRDYGGRAVTTSATSGPAEFHVQLRIANEYAFSDFVARNERARMHNMERKSEEVLQEKNAALQEKDAALRERNTALQQNKSAQTALREAQSRLSKVELNIKQLEQSTSFRVGRILVRAADNPLRGIIELPRQLYRLWRARRRVRGGSAWKIGRPAREPSTPGQGEASADPLELERTPAHRFLKYSMKVVTPRDRLVIAGVLQAETAETLRADCDIVLLAPHDALAVLERTDPDIVLVETAASEPGTLWTYFGDPAAVERERRLFELISEAHAIGRPVALWRNSPVHRTTPLDDVALMCDLVLDGPGSLRAGSSWHRGVSLGQHVPIAVQGADRSGAVYVGGWNLRESLAHHLMLVRALRAAGQHGLRIHPDVSAARTETLPNDLSGYLGSPVHWRNRARVNASAEAAIAAPFSVSESVYGLDMRILEQLAAGLRVVTGPNIEVIEALGGHVVIANEQDVEAVVEKALAAGPLDSTARWAALRTLFAEQATPVMLAHLVKRLGLDTNPLSARAVSVLARLDEPVAVEELIGSIARQRHLPDELIVAVGQAGKLEDRSFAELEALGVGVRIVLSNAGWPELAVLARSRWVIAWAGGLWDAERLLDLAIGAECSHADAVGLVPGEVFAFVSYLPFAGALVRREKLASEREVSGTLESWASRGSLLFGVGNARRSHQTVKPST